MTFRHCDNREIAFVQAFNTTHFLSRPQVFALTIIDNFLTFDDTREKSLHGHNQR